jgi:hypothetical protein
VNAVAEHMVTSHKVAIKIINKGRIKSLDMMDKVKQSLQCAVCMFQLVHSIMLAGLLLLLLLLALRCGERSTSLACAGIHM